MNKILCAVLLILLVNCSTTTTDTSKDQPKSQIGNIIDGFKNLQLPKF